MGVRRGTSLMRSLFGGEEPPFVFQGQLGGPHQHGHRKDWDKLDEKCRDVPDIALGTSTSGLSAAELLVHAGSCLSQTGRTFHNTAGHHSILQSSAPAALVFSMP